VEWVTKKVDVRIDKKSRPVIARAVFLYQLLCVDPQSSFLYIINQVVVPIILILHSNHCFITFAPQINYG